MLGVVLCGGKSSRMGSDKALLKLHAKTWAQTAIDKLSNLGIPVVLSVNKEQFESYSAIFPPNQLISDNDSLNIHGPLGGTLSVHLAYPSEDLVILGCDLPLMESDLLKELLQHYQRRSGSDVFAYKNEGEPEPLCGIYTSKGMAHIISLNQQNRLSKHSMKYMLEHVSPYFIPVPDDKKKCFRNFNAHAELNGL